MSTTFSVTRDDVINRALRLTGTLADGVSANANDLTNCSLALNIMLKEWAQKGYKGWLYRQYTFPFQAAINAYALGPTGVIGGMDRPVRIAQSWWQDAQGNKTPMVKYDRDRFLTLTPIGQTGTPINWYYDMGIIAGNGIYNVWPAPPDTNGTFGISTQKAIDDILVGAGTFDVPQTTYNALCWGLCDQVALEYGTPERMLDRITNKATQAIESAFNFEEEDASVIFVPNPQAAYMQGNGGGY